MNELKSLRYANAHLRKSIARMSNIIIGLNADILKLRYASRPNKGKDWLTDHILNDKEKEVQDE